MSPDNEIDLTLLTQADFETAYGLLPAEQTIVIRAYSDDTDDRLLAEIQPRFVIMFEPCVEFIRRIEVPLVSSGSMLTYMIIRFIGVRMLVLRYGCTIWCMRTHAKNIAILLLSEGRKKLSKGSSKNVGCVSDSFCSPPVFC